MGKSRPLSSVRALSQHKKPSSGIYNVAVTLGNLILSLEMTLRMMMAFTYLPGFVTVVFRGMPLVWRGRHRLLLCWLIFMQAVHPGRKTLEEMARWTPTTITAWRFGRLLKATYWNVHLIVSWLAQDLIATLPPPVVRNYCLSAS